MVSVGWIVALVLHGQGLDVVRLQVLRVWWELDCDLERMRLLGGSLGGDVACGSLLCGASRWLGWVVGSARLAEAALFLMGGMFSLWCCKARTLDVVWLQVFCM